MTHKEFNDFCRSLKATTYVCQWGGSHVWKIGGKVFAIGGSYDGSPAYTFKVSTMGYEVLRDQKGLRPAPYLASRGFSWIQHYAKPGLSDRQLKSHIKGSYFLVIKGLTKKLRAEFGLSVIDDPR